MVNRIKELTLKHFVSKKPKIVVLAYHRVADIEMDPWQLAVNPENFEQQIWFIKKNLKYLP